MREIRLGRTECADLSVDILKRGGTFCFKAKGFSMHPFVRDGDILIIHPASNQTLRKGDVVLYMSTDYKLIAHRITAATHRGDDLVFTLRGDMAPASTEQVSSKKILGKVVSLRRGRKVIHVDKGCKRLSSLLWAKSVLLLPCLFNILRMIKKNTVKVASFLRQ